MYFHFKWVWLVRKQKDSSSCPWYKISTERKTKGNMMNLEQGGFGLDKINTFFTIRYRKYWNSIARKGLGSSSLIKQWFYSVPLGFDSVMHSCWHWLEFNPFICLSWTLFGLWATWGRDHVPWADGKAHRAGELKLLTKWSQWDLPIKVICKMSWQKLVLIIICMRSIIR